MTTNYFKAHSPYVRPIDTIVPFNDADEGDTLRAWLVATEMAALTKASHVAAWRRPQHGGPWRECEVVT